jgi:SAM-dependent methyltransferase
VSTANEQQRANWNGESGLRWVADADRRDAILAPVADVLLGAAALAPGESVLDVGCGCGATTIAAGRAVAPGTATGIDISGPMLGVARERAAGTAVTFLEADAQTHPFEAGSFDVVMSRFGTMFFDDAAAAFTNLAGAVASGGRLCIATWQPLAENEWLALPATTLERFGELPDLSPATPGMFAQSDERVVGDLLGAAGWRDIAVEPVALDLRLGADAAEAADYVTSTGVVRALLDPLADDDRTAAVAAVTEALTTRESPGGVHLGANVLIVSASRTPATR